VIPLTKDSKGLRKKLTERRIGRSKIKKYLKSKYR
jgi:hypothetical protein